MWGCSSGGLIALEMIRQFPERVINTVVHEVPFTSLPDIAALKYKGEEEIVRTCKGMSSGLNTDVAAWEALGEEYHRRLGELIAFFSLILF